MKARYLAQAAVALLVAACVRAPSPLTPEKRGSIGLPHRGTLTGGTKLPTSGPGFARLRPNERRYGTPTFVRGLERAAAVVARAYPGSVLVLGDISAPHGGHLAEHFSHRNGRDADLLLYFQSLGGARVLSPEFIHVDTDGLARDTTSDRLLRFDVEREWLLVKTLVEDEELRVQWIFANHILEAMLIEWARAKGEPTETVKRAEDVMAEPHPGDPHDDHVHVRVMCTSEEELAGCEPNGPTRPWLLGQDDLLAEAGREDPPSLDELVREVSEPVVSARVASGGPGLITSPERGASAGHAARSR